MSFICFCGLADLMCLFMMWVITCLSTLKYFDKFYSVSIIIVVIFMDVMEILFYLLINLFIWEFINSGLVYVL